MSVGGDVSEPRFVKRLDPAYSEEAQRAGISGAVSLQIVIDEQGKVSEVEVVNPLGYGLDEQAVKAVKSWRFKPAMRAGEPVPIKTNLEINFRLLNQKVDSKWEKNRAL